MISRVAIKENSKAQLGNNLFGNIWLLAVAACLIVSAINGVISAFSSYIFAAISIIIAGPLTIGLNSIFLGLARGNGKVEVGNIFKVGFSSATFSRNLVLGLLMNIFIWLWSLLLVVPGIIKTYEYSMAYYVANDHPDWDWRACLNESKRLTEGYKADLFILDLSFIGWYLVGSLCLGLGSLWVSPYHCAARANYYEAIRGIRG